MLSLDELDYLADCLVYLEIHDDDFDNFDKSKNEVILKKICKILDGAKDDNK